MSQKLAFRVITEGRETGPKYSTGIGKIAREANQRRQEFEKALALEVQTQTVHLQNRAEIHYLGFLERACELERRGTEADKKEMARRVLKRHLPGEPTQLSEFVLEMISFGRKKLLEEPRAFTMFSRPVIELLFERRQYEALFNAYLPLSRILEQRKRDEPADELPERLRPVTDELMQRILLRVRDRLRYLARTGELETPPATGTEGERFVTALKRYLTGHEFSYFGPIRQENAGEDIYAAKQMVASVLGQRERRIDNIFC
jgi:hypothetical protein